MLNRDNPSTFYQIAHKYQAGRKIFSLNLFGQEQKARIDYGPNEDKSSQNQDFVTFGCTLLSTQQKIYFIECLNPNVTSYPFHKFKKEKFAKILLGNEKPIFILDFAVPAKVQEIRLPEFMHCFIQAPDNDKRIVGTYQLLKPLENKSAHTLPKTQSPQVPLSRPFVQPAKIVVPASVTKLVPENYDLLSMRMGRYDPLRNNAASSESEQLLETLISAMIKLSLTYYPLNTAESYFCRAAALIEYTEGGKLMREGVFVASLHKDGKIFHAEEVLAKLLYQIYGNNPAVLKNDKSISVKCLFIDIEPCDGKRYGKSHHCREFFLVNGRPIVDVSGKKRNILLKVENLFWGSNLPPAELNSRVRAKDPFHDYFLQVNVSEQLITDTFSQCYIVNSNLEAQKISLAQYFNLNHQKQKDLATKTKGIQVFLRTLLDENVVVDPSVKAFVASLFTSDHDNKGLQAIAEDWSLSHILKYLSLSMAERKALQEIQDYYRNPQHIPRMKSIESDTSIPDQAMIVCEQLMDVTTNVDAIEEPIIESESDSFSLTLKVIQEMIDEKIDLAFKLHSVTTSYKNTKHGFVELPEVKELKEMVEVSQLIDDETLEEGEIREEAESSNNIENEVSEIRKDSSLNISSDYFKMKSVNKQILNMLLAGKLSACASFFAKIKDPSYYEQILTFRTKSHLSLLDLLLFHGKPNSLQFYLHILHEAINDNTLSKTAFKALLLNRSISGLSPFHKVVSANNARKTIIFLAELSAAKDAKILSEDEINQLLTQATVDGFTPLHEVVRLHPENLSLYLETVKDTLMHEPERFIKLLTVPNNAGFTPLQHVLISGHPENLRLYLETVKDTLMHEPERFIKLLTVPNNAGFTPLHDVLKSGQQENVKLYLETIKEALADVPEQYVELLTASTEDGFTPLHEVLISGDPRNVRLYLQTVNEALADSSERLIQLLISPNKDGFTPLHEVLISGHPENVKIYLEAVKEALVNDPDRYIRLLTMPNKADFTPLHEVLITGNPENVKSYLETVKEVLAQDQARYIKLLTAVNKGGCTPLHEVLQSGNPVSLAIYLETIKPFIKKIGINFLIQKNQAGYNSFHQVAGSGNIESLNLMLDFIKVNFPETANDIITKLLWSKTRNDYLPTCQMQVTGSNKMNFYLMDLRKIYSQKETHVREQDRKRPNEARQYCFQFHAKRQKKVHYNEYYKERSERSHKK